MRLLVVIFIGIILLSFVQHPDGKKLFTQQRTSLHSNPLSRSSHEQRQLLIAALKKLRVAIATKDAEKFATLFSFPVPDSTLELYSNNKRFNEQLEANDHLVTRELFVRFYPALYEDLGIAELRRMFQFVPVDSLMLNDTLRYQHVVAAKPCYSSYFIAINDRLVTLSISSAVNESYMPSRHRRDEPSENTSEFCEHQRWWIFTFDGKNLKFSRIYVAG